MSVAICITVCSLGMLGLLWADLQESAGGRWASKPLASAAFVALAWSAGALDSSYGTTVLAALVLCWIGDVLLIPSSTGPAFLAGLISFLLGHVLLAVAFVLLGVSWPVVGAAAAVLVIPAALILRWLLPNLGGPMKLAVPTYILVITCMVALAVGAGLSSGRWLVPLGATCFFLSDIAVARERFVTSSWNNRAWGLPLYYGATMMLALSV